MLPPRLSQTDRPKRSELQSSELLPCAVRCRMDGIIQLRRRPRGPAPTPWNDVAPGPRTAPVVAVSVPQRLDETCQLLLDGLRDILEHSAIGGTD